MISSISSSNHPTRKRRVVRGFLWGVVFLLLAELFLFRNPALYGTSPASFLGQIANVQERLARQNPDRIKVLILGDSQSMDALRPPLLAAHYGVAPDEIFNLSVSGGKAVDMLHLYEEAADKLPNLKRVIIAVNEHQVNSVDIKSDAKFRYFATLSERMGAPHVADKADLVFGQLLYAYGLRDVWTQLAKQWWDGKLPQEPRDKYEYRWGLPPVPGREPAHLGPAYARIVADRWMKDYRLDGPQANAFHKLVGKLAKRGVQITIVQLPRTQAFEQVMKATYGQQQAAFRARMQTEATQAGASFTVIPPTLEDAYFRDANHVNEHGAKEIIRVMP
ncbi:hypothetical protein DFP93_10879 [Aneurinibacillus soli]|uniref:Uncharacterized protein n=1 Tax=Aneurinibacillus soli TaxID=1500254 RepID=A0A0U5B6E4_9BACL|nr:hypothetical protein [Aneurinibacillus soli]PYE61505.1 hypothetical protein DFP93_10879 [Aneurinibacillus soli]BAU26540.1 hypothetical protein CB4_00667 [Aneurinibacillus soli]